jgi:hypothetical protein
MESTFPKILYARQNDPGDCEDLDVFETISEAIDEDGPTEVGEYQLVRTKTFEKLVQEVEIDPDRPKTR